MAGLLYDRPWTRDAAINADNATALLMPEVTRNTLLSCLVRDEHGPRIGGQYWDAVIWTLGAWAYYVATGDDAFVRMAFRAVTRSLAWFEQTEFDEATGLFRGAAVYGDGVAAYPDRYAQTRDGLPCILHWAPAHPDTCAPRGEGLPMQVLSTNCVYVRAYELAARMAELTGGSPGPATLRDRAEALREAINRELWDAAAGRYRYFIDPFGGCDAQEGFGHAFAVLYGIADDRQRDSVFRLQHVTPAGIPCVWPGFERYETPDGSGVGRHSGTVWPQIQGYWAAAAAARGRVDLFAREFLALRRHALRDSQFAELYHPGTTLPYGGRQEAGAEGIREWASCPRQTWAATAYLRMAIQGLAGIRPGAEGLRFAPVVPDAVPSVALTGLRYRRALLNVRVSGHGAALKRFAVNGRPRPDPFLPAGVSGVQDIDMVMDG
jgi:glycogen debranching enzyme